MKKVIKASVVQSDEATYEPIDEGYENWEKEMRSNPEFQKLAKLCHLHGYQLHEAHNEKYPSGRLKRTIRMTPNESRAAWAKYLPEIYYRHVMKTGEEEFKAQTTSYGTLSKEEFSLFTTAVKHAEGLLDDLADTSYGWNLDSLYVWEMSE